MLKKIKSAFTLILWICLIDSCIAQKVDTIYYDADWNKSSDKDYEYFRLYIQLDGLVKVTDYYKNGRIQMTGSFKSTDFKEFIGPFFYYNTKNRITELRVYDPLSYPNIVSEINKSGISVPAISDTLYFRAYYFKNGKIRSLGYSSAFCKLQGTWLHFKKNGDLDYKVNYLNDHLNGEYVWYFKNHLPYIKGYYKDGIRNGYWEYFNPGGKMTKTVRYFNGNKIKTIH